MATVRRKRVVLPDADLPEVAWLRVARKMMPTGMTTNELYDRCGWTQGKAYWKRRTENIKISVAFLVANAIGVPIGVYVEALARELRLKAPEPKALRKPRGKKVDRVTDNTALTRALAELTPLSGSPASRARG